MRKIRTLISLFLCFSCIAATVSAARLNEWTFENDNAGLTLSQATNSGVNHAVFSNGGKGFLETDGAGNLRCTQTDNGTNGMWTSGAVLDASLTNALPSVLYLRYDLDYNFKAVLTNGNVVGLFVTDSSGNRITGVAAVCGNSSSAGSNATIVATNLSCDSISVIAKVDMSNQNISVWYDLTGFNRFNEASPAVTNFPINLASIGNLRFQATGNFQSGDSNDYVDVENIRMASTWAEITQPILIPLTVNLLFQNNMVLQRDMNDPIWGYVTPGTEVTVELDGATVGTAVADQNGRWMARIGSHAADGGLAHVLQVSDGRQNFQFTNAVFGDVYVASGQSNMQFPMKGWAPGSTIGYSNEQAAADSFPLIRHAFISNISSTTALDNPTLSISWTTCSAASLGSFSAVGYFFAKNVYEKIGVPVGLLTAPWSGQPIERFLSPSGVEAVPELAGMRQYNEEGGVTNLYNIYNGMISPLMPYGIKGVIWYQGEANAGNGNIYRYKMQALTRGWRNDWGQGNFPFYYVQLASYGTAGDYPGIREAQMLALSETNSGMAVAIDIGETGNIHPLNKYDVGRRLAQWALAKTYGMDAVFSGPLYRSSIIEGAQIRVLFDYASDGLIIGQKESTNAVIQVSDTLQNFQIAGVDKNFVNATAVIDRDTVLVSADSVPSPMYVRYCYSSAPSGSNHLYNAAGLPASPFRTDKTYSLTVISGSGSNVSLAPGATVSITATTVEGKTFDRWIGAASEIDHLNSSTAAVTMPDHSLYLLATYRDASASVYTLTVNNGYGSGTSQTGSVLNIEAATPPAGQVFDHWTGDPQDVVNAAAARTTLRMPGSDVTVTAVYRTVDHVGDGIPDTWRALYFGGDGTMTNSQSAADADPDGDGMGNLQEYLAGTSPVDAQSVLRLGDAVSGHEMAIGFPGTDGYRYRLEMTDNLLTPVWEPLFYNITGDGTQKSFLFDVSTASNRFYRVRLNAD